MKNQKRWKDMLAGALIVTAVAALAVPALAATASRNVRVDYSDIKLVINGETVTPGTATATWWSPSPSTAPPISPSGRWPTPWAWT